MKFWVCLAPVALFSLYMGNPAVAEMSEEGLFTGDLGVAFSVGYETDVIFDRPMKLEFGSNLEKNELSQFDYTTQMGLVQLNFFDRLEVYGGFGSVDLSIDRNPFPGVTIDYGVDHAFGLLAGGAGTLFFVGNFSCGFNANYFRCSDQPKTVSLNGRAIDTAGSDVEYSGWQAGVGVSYLYRMLLPYLGVAFSATRLEVTNPRNLSIDIPRAQMFKNDGIASLVMGLGLSHETFWQLNVEGRVIGETAFAFSLSIRL